MNKRQPGQQIPGSNQTSVSRESSVSPPMKCLSNLAVKTDIVNVRNMLQVEKMKSENLNATMSELNKENQNVNLHNSVVISKANQ